MELKRYHKEVYFPDLKDLEAFNNRLKALNWQYSNHCLDNIKYRILDIKALLCFIKGLELKTSDIFEYYKAQGIIKACYRVHYKGNIDIILVISASKNIITIYINEASDNHFTLKKELYQKF